MENNNYTYDAAANLMLAFRTLCELEEVAKDCNLRTCSMITEEQNGLLTFFLTDIPANDEVYRVPDIMTEEASIFAQKIKVFKVYWLKFMQDTKDSNAARIAALKAELAKLEGK